MIIIVDGGIFDYMKIFHIDTPVVHIPYMMSSPTGMVPTHQVYSVETIKSTPVTEYDDGLDEWLIDVKKKGHNEIYLLDIELLQECYDPINYNKIQYKLIRYFSRYHDQSKQL